MISKKQRTDSENLVSPFLSSEIDMSRRGEDEQYRHRDEHHQKLSARPGLYRGERGAAESPDEQKNESQYGDV